MPKAGDSFVIVLKDTHMSWGTHRYTTTRDKIVGESYIPIPRAEAIKYGIYNSNKGKGLGINQFKARSADGQYKGIIKSGGSSRAGDIYAKNFSESGNLKGFSKWFDRASISVGDHIEVKWISSTDVLLTKISSASCIKAKILRK